jgi:hypothetical protein
MTVRLLPAQHAARAFLFSVAVLSVLVGACSDDDPPGASPEMRKYCQDLFASPAFACCSAADRSERQFAARHRYQSPEDCASQLALANTSSEGRRVFDSGAAASCLSHINTRTCGAAPTTTVRAEEEAAACGRVMAGQQAEGQACTAHEDCKEGLFCPPLRDTGLSFCSKPAPVNQGCVGSLPKRSVDHPACEPGHICTLIGENPAGCPLPPCLIFQCVPFAEENEECTGAECGDGLLCLDGFCRKSGPSPAGGPCRLPEHCQDGLYCETSVGQCAAKKAAGEPCRSTTNALLECKGFCQGASETSGVCVAFCGSE